MRDWRFTEVQVGDRVIYTTKQSSSSTINEAKVIELLEANPDLQGSKNKVRVEWIRSDNSFDAKYRERKNVTVELKSVTVIV